MAASLRKANGVLKQFKCTELLQHTARSQLLLHLCCRLELNRVDPFPSRGFNIRRNIVREEALLGLAPGASDCLLIDPCGRLYRTRLLEHERGGGDG